MTGKKSQNFVFVKFLCLSALFCALITVVTAYFPKIPSPLGYVHLGDTFVCLCASVLPLPYSFLACALGGALADVLCSYAIYAPVTFVIKGVTACFFKSIYDRRAKLRPSAKIVSGRNVLGLASYIILCIGGYFIFEVIVYDLAGALAAAPMNFIQGVTSAALYAVFGIVLDKSRAFGKI